MTTNNILFKELFLQGYRYCLQYTQYIGLRPVGKYLPEGILY